MDLSRDIISFIFQKGDWLFGMDRSKIGGRESRQKYDVVIYIGEVVVLF